MKTKEEIWNEGLFKLFIKGLKDGIEAEYLIGALECMKSAYLARVYLSEKNKLNRAR